MPTHKSRNNFLKPSVVVLEVSIWRKHDQLSLPPASRVQKLTTDFLNFACSDHFCQLCGLVILSLFCLSTPNHGLAGRSIAHRQTLYFAERPPKAVAKVTACVVWTWHWWARSNFRVAYLWLYRRHQRDILLMVLCISSLPRTYIEPLYPKIGWLHILSPVLPGIHLCWEDTYPTCQPFTQKHRSSSAIWLTLNTSDGKKKILHHLRC